MEIPRITVQELKAMIDKNEPVIILDVRGSAAYATSPRKIKGAVFLEPNDTAALITYSKTLDKNIPVVAYCS
jgi:rhodanese-related sulfurtransferase